MFCIKIMTWSLNYTDSWHCCCVGSCFSCIYKKTNPYWLGGRPVPFQCHNTDHAKEIANIQCCAEKDYCNRDGLATLATPIELSGLIWICQVHFGHITNPLCWVFGCYLSTIYCKQCYPFRFLLKEQEIVMGQKCTLQILLVGHYY